jgi:adenylylsulfate kinase
MHRDTNARSFAKAFSWRIFGSLTTTVIVYVFTKRVQVALFVGVVELVGKILLFWLHERLWERIPLGKHEPTPTVIWFTGLSGSGKTTIAQWVHADLRRRGIRAEYLDGDTIRHLFPTTGFTRTDRDQHIRRVGYLASKLEENGVFVVASFISPYEESRAFVRGLCRNFVEVYVSTPLEECERRDVKGLYARARRGEIRNFTGIDDPYEAPVNADVVIDTRGVTVEESGGKIINRIRGNL